MAKLTASDCQGSCWPLCNNCQSLRLIMWAAPSDPNQEPAPRCALPAQLAAYANGGVLAGVPMAFDPDQQQWQSEPGVTPIVTLFCDSADGTAAPCVHVQTGPNDFINYFPENLGALSDGSMIFKSRLSADCDLMFKFVCVNDEA